MNPDVLELAQILTIVGGFALVMIGAVVTGFTILKRRPRERPQVDDNRLQHLEQAVDAIALEVERISEAQRFATKLLAQRQPDAMAPDAAAVPARDASR